MTRKLVTRRVISDVYEHPNADALELARIDGWQVVVKKNEFVRGDMCCFFEIDSFLPADDKRFEFLTKSGVKKDPSGRERIRLRTVKLRKELSQGLALPWTMFPELHSLPELEGVDLSEHLDVIKYERPEPQVTNAAGYFPECLKKTDEERCISEGTLIKTNKGDVEIKELCKNIDDYKVYTYNHLTDIVELKDITNYSIMRAISDKWLKITTSSGKHIIVTKNHRIFKRNTCAYTHAYNLEIGDELILF